MFTLPGAQHLGSSSLWLGGEWHPPAYLSTFSWQWVSIKDIAARFLPHTLAVCSD